MSANTILNTMSGGDVIATLPLAARGNSIKAAQGIAGFLNAQGDDLVNVTPSVGLPVAATVSGTVAVAGTVSVSNFPATQPVSGTVTAVASGTNTVTGTVTIGGTASANIAQVGGIGISLGQVLAAVSVPVVLASDKAVSISGIAGTSTITGTISAVSSATISGALPTGANTIGAVTCPSNTITGALPTGANTIGAVTQGTNPWVVDTELPTATTLADATAGPTVPAVAGFGMVWNGTNWDRLAGNTAGLFAQGNVAAGVTDTGNPLKIGGPARSAAPSAATAGNRVETLHNQLGRVVVQVAGATVGSTGATTVYGIPPYSTDSGGPMAVVPMFYNGSSADYARANVDATILASSARTVTTNSADQVNYNGSWLTLIVNVSSIGTGSISPTLMVKDSISGNYFTLWTAAVAITANGTYLYQFALGVSGGSATEKVSINLAGRTWRAGLISNNANSVTASMSGITGAN